MIVASMTTRRDGGGAYLRTLLLLPLVLLISVSSRPTTALQQPKSIPQQHQPLPQLEQRRKRLVGRAGIATAAATATAAAAIYNSSQGAASAAAAWSAATAWYAPLHELFLRYPFESGAVLAGAKGALADWVSQSVSAAPGDYDAKRTVSFGLWNALYCGGVCYYLYSKLFPQLVPLVLAAGAPKAVTTLGMVLFDNFLATPFVCLPTMYLCMALVESTAAAEPSSSLASTKVLNSRRRRCSVVLSTAAANFRGEWRSTLLLSWALWIPIHCVTFSVVPAPLRVHFTAACSFLTLMAMSRLVGVLERRRGGGGGGGGGGGERRGAGAGAVGAGSA